MSTAWGFNKQEDEQVPFRPGHASKQGDTRSHTLPSSSTQRAVLVCAVLNVELLKQETATVGLSLRLGVSSAPD